MPSLWNDIRYALRSMRKAPMFTLVVVLSLALGIGANTAIFSIFDQVLLRMLPVRDPSRLVLIASRGSHTGSNRGSNVLSYPMFKDYREKNKVFTGVLCRRGESINVGYQGSAERRQAEMVSGSYFEVLGVQPAVGRVFSMSDETNAGANPVVVLSYDYWQNRFGGNANIIGQTLDINNFPMTVVGVAQAGYRGVTLGFHPELFVPVTMVKQVAPSWGGDELTDRRTRWVQVFARLKPGVVVDQAQASIRQIYKSIIFEEVKDKYFNKVTPYARQQFLKSYAIVVPGGKGDSGMRRAMEKPLYVLMGLVGLVLLISCANVSNLLVARATSRQKEISLRIALGAGRFRIIRQLLTESLMLALSGGALGLLVASATTRGILLLAPDEQSREAISGGIDGRILLFTLAVSALAALLFGLIPALQVSRTDLVDTLKEMAGTLAGGHGGGIRKTLVVVQVCLSFLLLAGSGLFIQSLKNLRNVDPGFQPTNLVRFKLDPTLSGYDVENTSAFYRRLQERLDAVPGVKSASLAVVPIMEGDEWDSTVNVEGYQAKDGEDMNPHFNSVAPDYFKTLGIQILAGREFDNHDQKDSKPVAIVNETFAKKYFPGRSALGYHFAFGGPSNKPDIEIVGVAADTKYEDLRDVPPRQVFTCYHQSKWSSGVVVYVRTRLPSTAMFSSVRQVVRELDPKMPIFDLDTMVDQLDRSLVLEKFVTFLASAFGLLATVLAIIGLYGVTAFGVARRGREIGIRMALGAQPGNVLSMVLREVFLLAAIGIGLALPATWWLTQLLRSQLYGVEPRDPLTLAATTLALVSVAFLAGALPARRASRVDPAQVLRYE